MSIERLVKQRQLKKQIRRGAGAPGIVIDPESIADYRQRAGDSIQEETAGPRASVALARVVEPSLVPARFGGAPVGLEAAFLTFLQSKAASSGVPVERRLFLTVAESAEFAGLPVAFMRRLIACGKLKALKTGAGWRVSRVELEALSETLTNVPEDLEEHALRDIEENRRRRQGLPLESDSRLGQRDD